MEIKLLLGPCLPLPNETNCRLSQKASPLCSLRLQELIPKPQKAWTLIKILLCVQSHIYLCWPTFFSYFIFLKHKSSECFSGQCCGCFQLNQPTNLYLTQPIFTFCRKTRGSSAAKGTWLCFTNFNLLTHFFNKHTTFFFWWPHKPWGFIAALNTHFWSLITDVDRSRISICLNCQKINSCSENWNFNCEGQGSEAVGLAAVF